MISGIKNCTTPSLRAATIVPVVEVSLFQSGLIEEFIVVLMVAETPSVALFYH